MLLTEYNEAETMELFKEEGREEGVLITLWSMVIDKILTISEAAQRAGMTPDEFEKAAKNAGIS